MTDTEKLKLLIRTSLNVRLAQKEYFAIRKQTVVPSVISAALVKSKDLERTLDNLLVELAVPENTQQSLL